MIKKWEGFQIDEAVNGLEAIDKCKKNNYDLIIMDIMMPVMDGISTTLRIREKSNIPIIFLSAKSEDTDKIAGLGFGGDDYVTKPFDTKEIVARVKAVLRRSGDKNKKQLQEVKYDKLRVNLTNYELEVNNVKIDTPPKELELIYHLANNPNRVYTRDQLLDEVWGFEYYGDSRTVDVHVKRLREKLENVSEEWSLKTVWGVGYKFEVK